MTSGSNGTTLIALEWDFRMGELRTSSTPQCLVSYRASALVCVAIQALALTWRGLHLHESIAWLCLPGVVLEVAIFSLALRREAEFVYVCAGTLRLRRIRQSDSVLRQSANSAVLYVESATDSVRFPFALPLLNVSEAAVVIPGQWARMSRARQLFLVVAAHSLLLFVVLVFLLPIRVMG